MLKDLGSDFYRFSLSWSRIVPFGLAGSPVNQAGIDYYRNLSQELIDNGIEPMVTIYHWDLPQKLQDIGGWPNPELAEHFEYYARVVFENLGDLVQLWMTFNEPKQTCLAGYGGYGGAPDIHRSGIADYLCTHTVIKSHARVYHLYDKEFKEEQGGLVGMVIDSSWIEPSSDGAVDIEAAERAMQFSYGWYANPIVFGNYPQVMIDRIGEKSKQQGFEISRLPEFSEEEIEFNKGTYDFLAVNTYTTQYAAAVQDGAASRIDYYADLNVQTYNDPSWGDSASSWLKVVPWGIRSLVNWVAHTYDNNTEIYITENGFSDLGGLDDSDRVDYYREYLSNILDAILDDDINVTRYTAWSLMDNFEWSRGYSEKFGLYSVDFEDPDRPRTAKVSATYIKNVIATRCLVRECE